MSILVKAAALGIAAGILGLLISLTPFGLNLEENVGLQWLFKMRGIREPPSDVVVVSIDKASANAFHLPNEPEKWPRSLHAVLVRQLFEAGARVIAFDIIFDEPRSPSDDAAFASAIRGAGNVVLFDYLRKEVVTIDDETGSRRGELTIEKRVPPIPLLAQSAVASVPFPLPKIPAEVSQAWAFKTGAADVPTLPIVAFQIFASEAYEKFRRLLQDISPIHAAGLPPNLQTVMRKGRTEDLVRKLRMILKTEPWIGNNMLQALGGGQTTDSEAKNNRILHSLIRMYQGEDSYYLNYYGPAGSITTVSYHQVLQLQSEGLGKPAPVSLNGKAVFVGFSEQLQPEQKDDFYTVFTSQTTGVNISGVEIAATAFANLLEDMPVRSLPPVAYFGAVLLWGLLVGTTCRLLPAVLATLSGAILCALYLTLAYHHFETFGTWFPVSVPIMVQTPFVLFGGVLWRYVDTNRERRNIRRVLELVLPSSVVAKITEGNVFDITQNGQLVYGVCLFTDAKNYTKVSEPLEPTEVVALMNKYFAAVFQPVAHHGGNISDIKGDSVLALWATDAEPSEGADKRAREEARRQARAQACLAALDIAAAVDKFNPTVRTMVESLGKLADEVSDAGLPTRIGVQSGPISLEFIGAADHYELRPVGDTVNTSSRLEGLNKILKTRILVSEEVLEGHDKGPKRLFQSREVGKFLLAGKSRTVVIKELVCRAEDCDEYQTRLCTDFAKALDLFKNNRWEEASSRFARILTEYGPDGPTSFYLEKCETYRKDPRTAPRDGVVRMEAE